MTDSRWWDQQPRVEGAGAADDDLRFVGKDAEARPFVRRIYVSQLERTTIPRRLSCGTSTAGARRRTDHRIQHLRAKVIPKRHGQLSEAVDCHQIRMNRSASSVGMNCSSNSARAGSDASSKLATRLTGKSSPSRSSVLQSLIIQTRLNV